MKVIGKISLLVCGLVFAILIAETFLRISPNFFFRRLRGVFNYCVPDPLLGWRNSPDRDRSRPTGSGNLRILFLGDSVMYGLQLRPSQSIPAKVARMMYGVRSYNFGVVGYATDQELLQYRREGEKIKAKYVVIGVTLCNDAGNVANSIQYGVRKPQFDLQKGSLIQIRSASSPYLSKFQLLNFFWLLISSPSNTEDQLHRFAHEATDPKVQHAVAVTIALLNQLIVEIRRNDAVPIIVLFPYATMYTHVLRENHPLRMEVLKATHATTIDLFPILKRLHFIPPCHLNDTGTNVVASKIVKTIRRLSRGNKQYRKNIDTG